MGVDDDQDWRLEAGPIATSKQAWWDGLLSRARDSAVSDDLTAAVPDDVVITHDGRKIFAYAASKARTDAARAAIIKVLQEDAVKAEIKVSHWDAQHDSWRQVEPPLTDREGELERTREREEDVRETQTVVASAGRAIRAEFEQTMSGWATTEGLECHILEHPHVLTTQVAFTVTGTKHKIEEFKQALRAEGLATIRTETAVMLSPL